MTVLHDLGTTPAVVLRAAALPEDALTRGETLSVAAFVRFWTAVEDHVDAARLPLRMAENVTAEGLAPALFAALCSGDFAAAMQRLGRYKRIVGPGGYASTRLRDGRLRVEASPPPAQGPLPHSLLVTELAVAVQVSRLGTRSRVVPLEVEVSQPLEGLDEYTRFFGVRPVVVGHDSFTLSAEDAARPFLTENPAMWKVFEPHLRARLSEFTERATAQTRVRAALLELLPAGHSTVAAVAEKLGLSQRSLQRQLSAEQTSFQAVLSETRSDLARHYLQKTELSLAEIFVPARLQQPALVLPSVSLVDRHVARAPSHRLRSHRCRPHPSIPSSRGAPGFSPRG